MLSITWRSSVSPSNSRTSAPTMKPFSLPEMNTRPRIDLSRAPCSARSMIMASSSSGRLPREFWLSPSRSKTAQAMPWLSIEKRQSRNAFMSNMAQASLCSTRHCPRVVPLHHIVRLYLGRIEMVHRDHARCQLLHLGQELRFVVGNDALLGRVADPVGAVYAPHLTGANRAVELLLGGLGGYDLDERHLQ